MIEGRYPERIEFFPNRTRTYFTEWIWKWSPINHRNFILITFHPLRRLANAKKGIHSAPSVRIQANESIMCRKLSPIVLVRLHHWIDTSASDSNANVCQKFKLKYGNKWQNVLHEKSSIAESMNGKPHQHLLKGAGNKKIPSARQTATIQQRKTVKC